MADTGSKPRGEVQQLIEQGFRALQTGNAEDSIRICKQVLAQEPKMARAHYLAALIALASGDESTARKALQRTVEFNERHAPGWAQLALLYLGSGEFVKAEQALQNAVALQKGNPVVHDLIGRAFRLAGNVDGALHWHQKAVSGAPQHVAFLVNLANIHLYFGNLREADELLSRCLELEPANAQLHWLLSRTSKACNVWHIEAMQDLLAEQSAPRALAYLNYAIGKEAEDLEDWQLAGDAFAAGAAARRQTVDYDEDRERAIFETATRLFTRAWLEQQDPGLADAAPIFIVGEPRTGTTLLERMLGAHSRVNSAGELRHLGFAARRASGYSERHQFSPALLEAVAGADMFDLGVAYFESTASLRGDAAHLVDKLPVNYLYIPVILAALPKAKILHVVRDPMDSCFAIYKQLFGDAYLYSYDQQELARHYVRYTRLMAAWREEFPGQFLDVAYEDLVTDTEETLRTVCEYIGLSWQPGCLDFTTSPEAVTTASAAQVRERPHVRSIERWRRYATRLEPMREILADAGLYPQD